MSNNSLSRELRGKRLVGYSIGYFGIFLNNLLIGVFAFQYYVYTINLNSLLVSIGIALQLIIMAIFSIIFGVMIDNKKPGKFGKRRPFLIYGLPIWVLTSILIWLPPWYCPKNNSMFLPTAIYFWVIISSNAISGTSM
ncbi:MAG: MFS transporter, partial [Promethearchaeota archaeon]